MKSHSRRVVHGSTGEPMGHHLLMWCPGCRMLHKVDYTGPDGVVPAKCWTWDGNTEAPTVTPSLLVTWTYGDDKLAQVCHSYIAAGRWEFLPDSTHELAGQTVDMPDLPDWVVANH